MRNSAHCADNSLWSNGAGALALGPRLALGKNSIAVQRGLRMFIVFIGSSVSGFQTTAAYKSALTTSDATALPSNLLGDNREPAGSHLEGLVGAGSETLETAEPRVFQQLMQFLVAVDAD